MLHDRKDAIRQDLVAAQRALLDLLDQVGSDDWLRSSPNEGWTVRDLLTHLTTAESGFVPTLRRMVAGEGGVPADFDPNRWNAGQLRRRGELAPQALRAELESAHRDMLILLDSLDDSALDHRGQLSSGREGSTEDNFRLVAAHKRTHTEDIRAAFAPTAAPTLEA
ncbi:MAG: maleylpyruvate isomerase family mycothiol-dependent enzyme [Chloroflexi bacterium]|nr:maleylpyruvate isomerase family mycothiol-dependent enzyme [Chloroflexota bacterium]